MSVKEFRFKLNNARSAVAGGHCKAAMVRLEQAAVILGGLTDGGRSRRRDLESELRIVRTDFSSSCVVPVVERKRR